MKVLFTKKFTKQFNKLPEKNQKQFKDRLKLFLDNPHHSALRRHPLKGKYIGYYSIDIARDLRVIFRYQSNNLAVFSLMGTHSQLY